MTEFKKLMALNDALSKNVAHLISSFEEKKEEKETAAVASDDKLASNPRQLRYLLLGVKRCVHEDMRPRMAKMLAKATETDPNRQMFNEDMCNKIIAMVAEFDSLVLKLYQVGQGGGGGLEEGDTRDLLDFSGFDGGAVPMMRWVENEYQDFVFSEQLAASRKRERQECVANIIGDEEEDRVVVAREERMAFDTLGKLKVEDIRAVRAAIELAKEEKWQRELQRRKAESGRFASYTEVDASASCCQGPLKERARQLARQMAERGFNSVLHRVDSLLNEIVNNPDNVNVRRLRTDHPNVIAHFGHPCLVLATSDAAGGCDIMEMVERLLALVGFVPAYSALPTNSSVFLQAKILELAAKRRSSNRKGEPTPAGASMVVAGVERFFGDEKESAASGGALWCYRPGGWEEYGERVLQLMEPQVEEQPDEWVRWFDRCKAVKEAVAEVAAKVPLKAELKLNSRTAAANEGMEREWAKAVGTGVDEKNVRGAHGTGGGGVAPAM